MNEAINDAIGRAYRLGLEHHAKFATEMPWTVLDTSEVKACCTETGYQISKGVLQMPLEHSLFIILHEAMHCKYRHIQRSREIIKRYPVLTHHDVNMVEDALINYALWRAIGSCPEKLVTLKTVREQYQVDISPFDSIEDVCERIAKTKASSPEPEPEDGEGGGGDPDDSEQPENTANESGAGYGTETADDDSGDPTDNGSGSGTGSDDSEAPDAESGDGMPSDEQLDEWADNAERKSRQSTKTDPSRDGDAILNKAGRGVKKVDWQKYLKGKLNGLGEMTLRDYSRQNKKTIGTGMILPVNAKGHPVVLFAIDSSSSMDAEAVKSSVDIIKDVVRRYPDLPVYVMSYNLYIRDEGVKKFTPAHPFWKQAPVPSGGTSFETIIEARAKCRATLVINLTDMGDDYTAIDAKNMDGAEMIWLSYDYEAVHADINRNASSSDIANYAENKMLYGEYININK